MSHKMRWFSFAVLICAIGLVFGPHLDNDFVLDDEAQVVRNPHLQPDGSWLGVFKGDLWSHMRGKIGSFHSYYRPMMYLVYKVTAVVAGQSTVAFHSVSLLLHVACVGLLCLFLGTVGVPRNVAFAAPLLFLFYPITGETAFSIADMCDQLVLLGLLAALWCTQQDMDPERKRAWAWRVALFFSTSIGILSKETAVVIPAVVTLLVIKRHGWSLGPIVRHAGAAWLAILSYAPLRLAFLGGSHLGGIASAPWESVQKAGLALSWYVRHLLVPYPLSPIHPFPNEITESWQIILAISTLLVILALHLFALWRRETLFWMSWVFLPLAPSLFHFFFVQQIASEIVVAERYAYISAAGYCSVLGLVIDWMSRKYGSQGKQPHRFWTAILALALVGGILLGNYGHVYANEESIFKHALKASPNNPFVLNGVGQQLLSEERTAEALKYFSRAVDTRPNGAGFRINKGIALYRLEMTLAAQQEFETAITLDADIALAHTMLGNIYRDLGDVPQARDSYERSARLDPGDAVMLQNLGVARLLTGDREGAIDAWKRTLELEPSSCDTHFNLGTTLVDANRGVLARAHLLQFLDCAAEDREPQILTARRLLGTLQQ